MDIDKEPLITEKEEESAMGFKPYIRHKRRRVSMLSSVILLLATVALILTLTRLLTGNRLRLSSIQFILFESDNGKPQLLKVDFVAEENQCNAAVNDRYDCHPDPFANQKTCEARGCCWSAPSFYTIDTREKVGNKIGEPYCFYPANYPSYNGSNAKKTEFGVSVDLQKNVKSHWPNDILRLRMDAYYETKTRLRIKIYDPAKQRYEVPIDTPKVNQYESDTDYKFNPQKTSPFTFTVTRKDGVTTLFDTTITGAPLVFTDQFLQITTRVPTGMLYGLGEHRAPLYHNLSQWQQYSFWARDNGPTEGVNLYASHPFFMSFDKNNQAYGVFLLNSNAMDTDLQPSPAITFRTIGGVLDFYIFTGPTPDQVVQQYTDVIGKPYMPPYWALGFHLCRYGYNSTETLNATIKRMRDAQFPYDTQWTDIDYMYRHLDWTYDTTKFHGLPDIVQDLHDHGQHYVIIVDPGISSEQPAGKYPPFDIGIKNDVFIKNSNGKVLIGVVWPGKTAFPDFTNPATVDYWYDSISDFHKTLSFDGVWIDMDEPSNFMFGSIEGCTNSSLDRPPYVPGIAGSRQLPDKTICASAQQHMSTHYNLHSLYGHFEAIATNKALEKLLTKRSLVISRSTFPSTGHFAGHWSGDNRATWHDLQQSVPEMLNFQMFGIPLIGADICGFGGDTNEELCIRWMQLGAFYPFMRNHNSLGQKDQDPAIFSESAQQAMRSVLKLRYRLLPYMYTKFYESHLYGTGVVKPLSFKYQNENIYNIDTQFLWGENLLISPVLEQVHETLFTRASSVKAYFPVDTWYNYDNGSMVPVRGSWVNLPAPLDTINVHQRGGSIMPTQRDALTTTAARQLPFSLQVALDQRGQANGSMYWDDGETIAAVEGGGYTLLSFSAKLGEVKSEVVKLGYTPPTRMTLEAFRILGLPNQPSDVKINDKSVEFHYDIQSKVLHVQNLAVNLLDKVLMTWV